MYIKKVAKKGVLRVERVVIIGCGQHANVVTYNLKCQGKYDLIGYFDADKQKVGEVYNGLPVLDCYKNTDLSELREKYEVSKFFIGFGNMKYRKAVYNDFVSAGWQGANIFHPNAVISTGAVIGDGVLIEAGCLITPNPVIGNNVVINTGSQVNHDNVVESHVYIASGVILSGGVTIRENTLIDDGVIVCLGRTVGKNCIIGAGAVVTKDVPDNVVAYGNPCRVIRENIF